jgi:hypothetical protein
MLKIFETTEPIFIKLRFSHSAQKISSIQKKFQADILRNDGVKGINTAVVAYVHNRGQTESS